MDVNPDGKIISKNEYDNKLGSWLPSENDKEYHRLNSFNPIQKSKVFDLINDIYKENKSNKNKNKIALIGLRGAGKSTLGNMLHKEFNYPLFEATNEIENLGGMNINEIIELGGQGILVEI